MQGPTEQELQLQIHQRLLDELIASNQAFHTHVDMLEEVIFRCAGSGEITLLNPAWTRLLGWSLESSVGASITDFLAPGESADRLHDLLKKQESIACDLKLRSRFGLTRHFRVRARFNGEWYGSMQDVTDMRNVIAQLNESQKQSRKLSQVASRTDNLVVITDKDGLIEWVNQSFETITGYDLKEVVGLSPGSFLQGPGVDAAVIKTMSEGIRKATGFKAEVVNYTKSGEPYWISIDCSPVFDQENNLTNFIAIERDISEQKKLENVLRENERRYRNVLNSVSEPIFQCDSNLEITFTNKAWSDFVGCCAKDSSEQPSCRLSDLVNQQQQGLLESTILKAFESETSVRQEFMIETRHNQQRRVELVLSHSVNPLSDDTQCLTGSLVDIEEQWQINQEILKAKQKAEELSEARTRFVANMSHEIRTPLNAIIGMTSVLEQTDMSEKQKICLDTISKGGNALLAVINDILDFAKLDHGEQEIEQIPFNWNDLFEETVDLLSGDIELKQLRLSLSSDTAIPETLSGDLHKIRQVLTNLLSNAIKFTSSGEITIDSSWRANKEGTEPTACSGGWLTFKVKDTGIGIEPDRLETLFDPFTQADASVTRKYGGTGLGLAICKQICQALGGDISVTSDMHQGTTMSVSLPLQVAHNEAKTSDSLHKPFSGHIAIVLNHVEARLERVLQGLGLLANIPICFENKKDAVSSIRLSSASGNYQAISLASAPAICTPRRLLTSMMHESGMPLNVSPIKAKKVATQLCPLKILIAEDSIANQVVIRALLEQQGYQDVTLVNNGQEALDKFHESSPDLVFLDIHMPVMDGFTTASNIRKMQGRKQPVIYALTADVTSEAIDAAEKHGIDLWVTKPVTGEALRQALEKYPDYKKNKEVVMSSI